MKFQIHTLIIFLFIFPFSSFAQDFDEPTFENLAFFGFSSQLELIKEFCGEDERNLALIVEAEKEFIKNSPNYLKLKINPPRFSEAVRQEIEPEQENVNKIMKEGLAKYPREEFCMGYAANLRKSNFQEYLATARRISEDVKRKAKSSLTN